MSVFSTFLMMWVASCFNLVNFSIPVRRFGLCILWYFCTACREEFYQYLSLYLCDANNSKISSYVDTLSQSLYLSRFFNPCPAGAMAFPYLLGEGSREPLNISNAEHPRETGWFIGKASKVNFVRSHLWTAMCATFYTLLKSSFPFILKLISTRFRGKLN